MNAAANTCGTKIIVTSITDAAVKVIILHGVIAVVAVDHP